VSAVLLLILRFLPAPRLTAPEKEEIPRGVSEAMNRALDEVLEEFYIAKEWRTQRDDVIRVSLPANLNFLDLYLSLIKRVQNIRGHDIECIENLRGNRYTIKFKVDTRVVKEVVFTTKRQLPGKAGTVAIIIDDFGYSYNEVVREFIFFQWPLTLSIIPGLNNSGEIAREAKLAGKEILVHMPMEPLDESFRDEGFILLVGQDPGTIRLRLQRAFSILPDAAGLNNHQGSRITTDLESMKIILGELKALDKFFIDSRTHPNSVSPDVAKNLSVPFAANEIFLDVEDDEEWIYGQIDKLAELAAEKAHVIAIGHVRPRTLRILQSAVPELESRGIRFVFASSLLR
jgi:polysaccharide deacetylase 2 family uncharacterized protein YibQ